MQRVHPDEESARQREWREKVLKLRNQKKDRILEPNEAWRLAEKLELDYLEESVPPDTDILNAYLQLCLRSNQARQVMQRFAGKARPNTTSFNILISLARDRDEAAAVFDELLHAGLAPNTNTLNGFLPFCQTLEEGRETVRRMDRFHVRPNTQTFHTLITKATSTEQARQILRDMQQRHLDMNTVTLRSLIVAADHFQDAMDFYREYVSSGLKPTINTLLTLLKKTSQQHEIAQVEKEKTFHLLPANLAWTQLLRVKERLN